MKKKKLILPQLNKSSAFKLVLFVVLIILIEIAVGVFVFNQFSSRTYKQEFAAYASKTVTLSDKISNAHSSELGNIESDGELLAQIKAQCSDDGQFDYYIVFGEAQGGRIIDGGGLELSGNIGDYGLNYAQTSTFAVGGKTYVFAPSELGESGYRIAGIADFTERQGIINNLRGNTIAALVVAGLIITALGAVYAYALSNKERTTRFGYRATVDGTGKVLRSNRAFKNEFSAVSEIPVVGQLDKKTINLVTLSSNTGEKVMAVRVDPAVNRSVVYAGDIANADAYIGSGGGGELDKDGKATATLRKMFESFVVKGKRTLLGVMFIGNLDRIKTLFGKQMAVDIQRIILKKAREKFTYAYELDFGYIGVTYPDGKKLDILLSELEDVHVYINSPIKMEDNLFTLDVKMGFAMCDAAMQHLDFDYAYKAAEAARQRIIDTNIADFIVYHESQKKLYAKYFITYDIKQMLADGAFEMEYQPQYNIKEERIEGFEALFRVKKSWDVNVDTFSFITYAERTGAMVQLGDFIFDTGMKFAKSLEGKNVSVSLNVSPVQLMQAGFTENFLRIYKKYNLKPRSICVEITESFLMTNFTETLKKLDILTAQGIDVHLDDFGTEYSSLLYIKKLPISTIKIDKEFVKDVLTSKESQAVIKFITNIAKLLNKTTICEGVETTQEFDMLNYLGCDTIQGWLIGKSMKPEAALQIVDNFDYRRIADAKNGK